MVKIGVSGARGRMGQRIINLAGKDREFEVVFGLETRGHPDVGDLIEGIEIGEVPEIIKDCDCLIEFSSPVATIEHLRDLIAFKKCAVIGTTGFDEAQRAKVESAAIAVPIVFSPNMSVGVNVLFRLIKEAAAFLGHYTAHIEEAHHVHKKDAPSGTAKRIAEIIAHAGFDIKAEEIKSIREGEIVGDHRVVFESDVDRIELGHYAKTRDIFAQGALIAAKWIASKKPGLYSMDDVLFDSSAEGGAR